MGADFGDEMGDMLIKKGSDATTQSVKKALTKNINATLKNPLTKMPAKALAKAAKVLIR